jgi:hypothetical protein
MRTFCTPAARTWTASALVLGGFLIFQALGACQAGEPGASGRSKAKPKAPVLLVVKANSPNTLAFPAAQARFIRFVIHASAGGQPCIDELEVYGPDGKRNLALAKDGAKPSASSCLEGNPLHQIAHLNEGQYGNGHSWIAATDGEEWAQIELPQVSEVASVVFSRDRQGQFSDRVPVLFDVQLSLDGRKWTTAKRVKAEGWNGQATSLTTVPLPQPLTWDGLLRYAFQWERATWERISHEDQLSPFRTDHAAEPGGKPYWKDLAQADSLSRVLRQLEEMIDRLAAKGLDVTAERGQLQQLRQRKSGLPGEPQADGDDAEPGDAPDQQLYLDARLVKRRLMFRDPDLAPLEKVLFVKRHPYTPSHNYSDIFDSAFRPGGGVCVLEIPRRDGRFEPAEAKVTTLFDATKGIARDAMADFRADRIYFAYRPSDQGPDGAYWHVMVVNRDGSGLRQLTQGPFHDYYPCPLPDGKLAFISTRCKCRFLCWRPQAFVLFRMDLDGGDIAPLSNANLSEWSPGVMRDGRIIWTRTEYVDKGADFGHNLWAARPDGTHPVLLYGNDTTNCYMNGREVPGTSELCCTIVSHGGDFNGPVGLIDVSQGPFHRGALTNITPDVTPSYHMSWPRGQCFRDPVPISRDYYLVSHAPGDRFGLYVIDRWGNREVLYFDPAIGSMCPTLLRPVPTPPVLATNLAGSGASSGGGATPNTSGTPTAQEEMGQFAVADVYRGLEPAVKRGRAKYLRVCQEVRSDLEQLPDGQYRADHEPFQDFYASPTHMVTGPYGWPSYVAKASLGTVPVEEDGSANFYAPAGKVLYFELLDENLNELQRMRSVVQLQPGEKRSCIGCHEQRTSAPPVRQGIALRREPRHLDAPSWGPVPFSYEKVVQPVLDAHCVRCHDDRDKQKINLAGTLDRERIPASYRTLITQGWVHHFNLAWGMEHTKADPLTFGTLKSRLWDVLNAGHRDVKLSRDEMHRVKCWIDLNCPLWPDYMYRPLRAGVGPEPRVTQRDR